MKLDKPGLPPENNICGHDVKPFDMRIIYDFFIERYEHLDMLLRSEPPPPHSKDEVQAEKSRVEAILAEISVPFDYYLTHICSD